MLGGKENCRALEYSSEIMHRGSLLGLWVIIYKAQKPLTNSYGKIWNVEKHYFLLQEIKKRLNWPLSSHCLKACN